MFDSSVAIKMISYRLDLLLYFTFLTLISSCISYILKPIWILICKPTSDEYSLNSEIRDLRKEQQKLSIKDQFAAHAKLERRLIKLKDELKSHTKARLEKNVKLKTAVKLVLHCIITLVIIVSVFRYKNAPLVVFNQNMFPFGSFLGYSSDIPNSIVPHSWVIISRVSLATLMNGVQRLTSHSN